MTSAATASPDPLAGLGVGALLDGAARLRPSRIAMTDRSKSLSFSEVDRRVTRLAAQIADLAPPGSAPLLLVGGASVTTILLTFAALRGGRDIALAPAFLDRSEIVDFARQFEPELLAADATALDLFGDEGVLALAADIPSIRLVGASTPVDGGVWLDDARDSGGGIARSGRAPHVFFPTPEGDVRSSSEAQLLSAALDVVTTANVGSGQRIVSTLAPTGVAGLVTGPLAALLSGATLSLQSPFEASRFHADVTGGAPCHVVVPAALERSFAAAFGGGEGEFASLILVSQPHIEVETGGGVPHKCPTFDVTQFRGAGCAIARRTEPPGPLAALGERMRAAAAS